MGQGTDSCGGWEVEYDPVAEGLASGKWMQRNGVGIRVEDMSISHLRNARRYAQMRSECETFSSDADDWREWVEIFDEAIEHRESTPSTAKYTSPSAIKPTRGAKITMICHCGNEYQARRADIARGFGLSCSKRCASIRREFRKPAAKPKE